MRITDRELLDTMSFQQKFGLFLPTPQHPILPVDETDLRHRVEFLLEELHELRDAVLKRDFPEVADALVDMAYVLKGTAVMLGLAYIWNDLWYTVHAANMTKVRLPDNGDPRGRYHVNVMKPVGWIGPDIEGVMHRGGWKG